MHAMKGGVDAMHIYGGGKGVGPRKVWMLWYGVREVCKVPPL